MEVRKKKIWEEKMFIILLGSVVIVSNKMWWVYTMTEALRTMWWRWAVSNYTGITKIIMFIFI